ncbi:MAG: hypothetical protein JSW26_00190 [Desulfobacterales bacterium]|nr:MAG: hypothetical protein JSW26_00190 [Desulfobacterales bacterium]
MSFPQRFLLKFLFAAVMLLGLPLAGVLIAGFPVDRYLEFPPQSRYVQHAPFSWPAFFIFVLLIAGSVYPLAAAGVQSYRKSLPTTAASASLRFPWWGWVGVTSGAIAWILAWTRFSWFAAFQPHTFSPLWFSYILVVNALCWRRSGHSLMTDRPGFFLLLFPASAAFWWLFEYLNRFVQNWYYTGVQFGPWAYFWYATLPFSTVLPAVLSTRHYLLGVAWINRCYARTRPIKLSHPVRLAAGCLLLSAAGLAGIGVWPNYLFPLLWVSPLLILVGLQTLMKDRHSLSQMAAGDWSGAVAAALAALVCGGFWEMWNYFSLAKWQYTIPLVDRFQIFEMPLLGYAGYLPFGLECVVIGDMLGQRFNGDL